MAPGCVYDCAHPLWGSDGTCSINNDGEATCACSPGYASKDVLGNSSCVPTIVLWGFFLLGAVIGATMTLFLMWHIVKFFDIRGSARHTRKAILRLQILAASSTVTGGVAICCIVVVFHGGNDMANGEANLWDFYIIQTALCFFCPPIAYMFSLMIEYWLLGLPPQFLQQDGFAAKLQDLASSRNLFTRTGIIVGAAVLAVGATTYSGSRRAYLTAEMVLLLCTDLGGLVMAAIGFEIVAVINLAEKAGNGKEDTFYGRAKRRIWSQVFGCCLILAVNTVAMIMLLFTHVGWSTPVIPMGFHFCCGLVISCPFAHLTAFAGVGQQGGGAKPITSPLAMTTISQRPKASPTGTAFKSTMAATAEEQPSQVSKEGNKVADHQDAEPNVDKAKTNTSWTAAISRPGIVSSAIRREPSRVVPTLDNENLSRSGRGNSWDLDILECSWDSSLA